MQIVRKQHNLANCVINDKNGEANKYLMIIFLYMVKLLDFFLNWGRKERKMIK